MLDCDTADLTGKLLLAGLSPESRWRWAFGEVERKGNCVEIWTAAEARAWSSRGAEILMVWFASSTCFSSALNSSSWKMLHHAPLARPSFGSLSRQGSGTSHFAGTGAAARWYFGPTVQPEMSAQTANPIRAGNCLVRFIIVSWPLAWSLAAGQAGSVRGSAQSLSHGLPVRRRENPRDSARSSR